MARRRANHEGTLYRRKDGLWCAQVSLDGHRLTKYGKTQRECHDWIKETLAKIDSGLTCESIHITLESFINYLAQREAALPQGTDGLPVPQDRRELHPPLPREDADPEHPPGSHPAHVLHIPGERHGCTHPAADPLRAPQRLRPGCPGGNLLRNPADAVERPRWEHKEFKAFTEDEARQFLLATAGHRHEALFYLALTTGMREGELLGLKWSDIDWRKGVVNIQRQLQRIERKGLFFVPPKTKAGRRQIKLGQGMLDRLAEHRITARSGARSSGQPLAGK